MQIELLILLLAFALMFRVIRSMMPLLAFLALLRLSQNVGRLWGCGGGGVAGVFVVATGSAVGRAGVVGVGAVP